MNKKIIHSIILARGNSKGIKNKNLIKIKNKPLIYWSIKNSLNSKKIKHTWVSSDSKKILNCAKKYGAKIIKRPKKYSNDNSSSESGWIHAVRYIEKLKYEISSIVGIQATSPIRSKYDLDEAIKVFNKKKLNSLFTSSKIKPKFIWKLKKKKFVANYNFKKRPRTQEIKSIFQENGSFYIFEKKGFIKNNCRLFGKIGTFTQSKIKSFEIDDKKDLFIVESLMKKIGKNLK